MNHALVITQAKGKEKEQELHHVCSGVRPRALTAEEASIQREECTVNPDPGVGGSVLVEESGEGKCAVEQGVGGFGLEEETGDVEEKTHSEEDGGGKR